MSHPQDPSAEVAADEYLAERYGARRPGARRLGTGARVAIVAALVAAVAVAAWFAVVQQQRDPVSFTDVGFSVVSAEQVDVTFRVSMPPGMEATCLITAMNTAHAQVGALDVVVGPSDARTTQYTVTVRTTEEATTGIVDSCTATS
ncbi:DUF4307 domain-containing protein [Antribacter gilvus]|uniref:DUF4307 domain-containing protein n=1 Tax=Antribacter gilvus TaxID=2304675 RepID=UPI000F7B9DFC|nr:DUF4307 domain-containing protein [Antribacter gilvus]